MDDVDDDRACGRGDHNHDHAHDKKVSTFVYRLDYLFMCWYN